ncbi:MAG: amino acid permease [Kangiellaceae bacterium]|jgi:APA family basic amino acid/polyamine antiporter|nr:amino acid permease [Kangiellaceae bacterium]
MAINNKKDIKDAAVDNSDNSSQSFGLAIATSLVIGTMIGSGIFLLPASLAGFGQYSFYGWLFSALGAVSLAWVFAKLSHWQPGLGGPYFYTRIGVGEFPAFLVAWGYWVSIWTGNAAIAVAAVSYCKTLLPILNQSPVLSIALALGFVWLFTLVNISGVKEAGKVQLITTLLKAIPLIIFAVIGIFLIDFNSVSTSDSLGVNNVAKLSASTSEESPIKLIIAAAALWLWAFLGVESASIPAENIKDPTRTIPKATMLGVLIVAAIYLIGFIVVFGTLKQAELAQSSAPFADAASRLWGDWAGIAMAVVALISTLGALNGLILMGGQMPMAAARDNLFPAWFAKQNNKSAPMIGIILSSSLTSLLVLLSSSENLLHVFEFAILLSTTAILVAYLFSSSAAFRLQMQRTDQYKIISLVIIVAAFLFSLWAVAGAGQEAVYWGFILMMAGLPFYTLLKIAKDRSKS